VKFQLSLSFFAPSNQLTT